MTGVAIVPELRGDRILLNAHTDEDVVTHVAGEDEETARRFGWWPNRSTEKTVQAAYADRARSWHDNGGSPHRSRQPRLTPRSRIRRLHPVRHLHR
jgi:hypothetical protein